MVEEFDPTKALVGTVEPEHFRRLRQKQVAKIVPSGLSRSHVAPVRYLRGNPCDWSEWQIRAILALVGGN